MNFRVSKPTKLQTFKQAQGFFQEKSSKYGSCYCSYDEDGEKLKKWLREWKKREEDEDLGCKWGIMVVEMKVFGGLNGGFGLFWPKNRERERGGCKLGLRVKEKSAEEG